MRKPTPKKLTLVSRTPTTFEAEIEARRVAALRRVENLPIAALIWGPAPTGRTPVAKTRLKLKEALISRGHVASFSEDLIDPSSTASNLMQQVAQVEAYDIVFSIPDSPGSIAEIHDFARIPHLSNKVVAFLNSEWNGGYSNQSLMQLESPLTCQIQLYTSAKLPDDVVTKAIGLVSRLQEAFYLIGRRCM